MSWHPLSPKVQAANKIIAEQEFAENMRTYQSKRGNSQAAAQAITSPYAGPNFMGVKPTPPARVTITEGFNMVGAKKNPNLPSALHDFESRLPNFPKFEVGKKFDQDRPDWSLLPLNLLSGVVKVLTFGAKKYARDNWMHVPDAKNRYSAALMRHFAAWQSGEKVDEETGLSHLHHIGCCLVFLIWFEENA